MAHRNQRVLGLQRVAPVDDTTDNTTIDIIAIHGLETGSPRTWEYRKESGGGGRDRGVNWISDSNMLPAAVPNARIYTYDWHANCFEDAPVQTLLSHADNLLARIAGERVSQDRPIIFVASCFGGLILAEAICRAGQEGSSFRHILLSTVGAVFLATPFCGSDAAAQAKWLVTVKGIVGEQSSDQLVHDLEEKYDFVRGRVQKFAEIANAPSIRLPVNCFFETKKTELLRKLLSRNLAARLSSRYTHKILVAESSACLHGFPRQGLHAAHSEMNKFSGPEDPNFKLIRDSIKNLVQRASDVLKLRKTAPIGQKIPSSNVPFAKDPNFVGRKDILDKLDLMFSQRQSHTRVVLTGLGGIGKSQIAIEYSYRLRKHDPQTWVFWVYASSAERFEQGYRSIAAILELPEWNNPKTDILDLVCRWLSDVKSGRWFLILDNSDDIDVFSSTLHKDTERQPRPLSSFIPQTETGSILITTRDRQAASWLSTGYSSAITVDLMTQKDAEQLLHIKIPDGLSSAPERAELVKELDYLPLAITQAAAYISARATRMSVSKYLTLYRGDEVNQSRLLDEDSGDLRRNPGVPNSVIRTWQISFDQIKGKWPSAAELLSLMAMLDRQGIPDFLLRAGYPDPLDFEAAINPLEEFSFIFIEKGGTRFEMHRLVQLATRKWLGKCKELERWQKQAVELVSKAFPTGEYSNWDACETLWPHAQEVLKAGIALDTSYLTQAALLEYMAWYSWLQGRYSITIEQCQESLRIREQLLNDNDTRIFDSVGLLGLVLRAQGKYDEAETMNRRALAGRETALGPTHPDTLTSVNNLATVLRAQGKYDEAETMNRRALAGRETALGPTHPNTLTSVGNLATVLYDLGKYDEAETMTRRALAGYEAALGPTYPDTLTSVNNLATVLQAQGKYDEAETMNRRALAGRETALGPTHPNTLTSVGNLALVLQAQGKYDEAETINRRALAGTETALGPTHPDTLTSVHNLALVLQDQGKYDEAETMNRRALAGTETALGPTHPDTLGSVFCLAALLEAQDNSEEAAISYERALSGFNKVLGSNHPTTILCSQRYSSFLKRYTGVISQNGEVQ